jgi:hypothetical protein
MSTLFSGPPKPPPIPAVKPPRNTALDAQLQALSRRAGAATTTLTGPGGRNAGTPSVGGNQLTGQ